MVTAVINLPILVTLSGGLTLLYYVYHRQRAEAIIPVTISMNQKSMKENQ